jgi:hypothetical protein
MGMYKLALYYDTLLVWTWHMAARYIWLINIHFNV